MKDLPLSFYKQSQAIDTGTMTSTCKVMKYSAGANDRYNEPVPGYTDQLLIQCGIRVPSTYREASGGQPLHDYVIRLPAGTDVVAKDRIKIVSMQGNTLPSPIECSIIGVPYYGRLWVSVKAAAVVSE